jgi:hypothetical protein
MSFGKLAEAALAIGIAGTSTVHGLSKGEPLKIGIINDAHAFDETCEDTGYDAVLTVNRSGLRAQVVRKAICGA